MSFKPMKQVSFFVAFPPDYEKAVEAMPSLNLSFEDIARNAVHEHITNTVNMYRELEN